MKAIDLLDELLAGSTFVDLTWPLEEGMPYWPTQPPFEAEVGSHQSRGDDSYWRKITFCEHTGTHIDAGCHFVPGQPSIDQLPLTQVIGRGVKIDATHIPPLGLFNVDEVKAFEEQYGEIKKGDIVFFHFGWDQKYANGPAGDPYLTDWPGISLEVGQYLESKGVKAIGCDMLSLDSFDSTNPNHPFLLSHNVNIIENVKSLGEMPTFFGVIGLPCKFKDGSGSTLRLIAVLDKDK